MRTENLRLVTCVQSAKSDTRGIALRKSRLKKMLQARKRPRQDATGYYFSIFVFQAREETSGTCPACRAGPARRACACSRSLVRRLMERISVLASIASTSAVVARSMTSRTFSRKTIASMMDHRHHCQGHSSRLTAPSKAMTYRNTSADQSRPMKRNRLRTLKPRQVEIANDNANH